LVQAPGQRNDSSAEENMSRVLIVAFSLTTLVSLLVVSSAQNQPPNQPPPAKNDY